MRPRFRPLPLVLCVLPACQGAPADTSSFTTTPPASEPAASSDASTGSAAESSTGGGVDHGSTTGELSTTSTGDQGASTTLILDVGTDVDAGDGKPVGCKGKIDFLFVISRYGGMEGFQKQLLDAFPKFIKTIETRFADFDYHIMVVDGDEFWGLSTCDEQCPLVNQGQCTIPDYPCDYTPTWCDTGLGTGVVFPAGGYAANKPCPIAGGRRYMDRDQPDLAETFACAAKLGISGASRMGETMAIAVQPWMNDRGSCNEGFLRDDALLMVTLITNTYDQEGGSVSSQEGTPETWMAAVREAKHGDLESVVALGILPTEGPGCDKLDRLCQMLELFPHALNRDCWGEEYGSYFEEAADLVEVACAGFVPPG